MKQSLSEKILSRAKKILPGGVNSPVRSFKAVGGNAFVAKSGDGAFIVDVDGNKFIDLVCSWGALIHGHNSPEIREAVIRALEHGTSFGITSENEIELAELMVESVPGLEMLRLVNSGTEACMSALRLARGATGRDLVVKFEGNYHGHGDSFLVAAGSGVATLQVPESAGVTKKTVADTIAIPFNDVEAVQEVFKKYEGQIAAVILEVVCGNMGVILPSFEFLSTLRKLTQQQKTILIFDEVMTGFRLALEGVQKIYGIQPDLFTFGKVIGGGFPLAAYGGRRDLMEKIAPLGPVYQAGTLSGNPIASGAGVASLKLIRKDPSGFFQALDAQASEWKSALGAHIQRKSYPVSLVQIGSMLSIFFRPEPPQNFQEAKVQDLARFKNFFWNLLEAGVYYPPSAFEACFLSIRHDEQVMSRVIEASMKALDRTFTN